jgi:hypothetical protein
MFSLFKRFNQYNSAVDTPASAPNIIDINDPNSPAKQSESKLTQTNVPVIAVRDHEDDGFSHVQIRPLTYAEVASMTLDDDGQSHRVVIPCEAVYPDSEDEALQSSVESVLQTSNTYTPRYGIQVASEFEYGDRIRAMKHIPQGTLTKPHSYVFKPASDKLVKNHVVKLVV